MALSVVSFTPIANWFLATTPRSTPATLNWGIGAQVVIMGGADTALGTLGNPTNANLTFGAPKASVATGGGTECEAYVWVSAPAGSAQVNQAIQGTEAGSSSHWGIGAWVIEGGPTGFANATANLTETAISRTVTAGSIVCYGFFDFNATNPPGKTPLTGSGTATERVDVGNGTNYGIYMADWVGTAAGTFNFGPNNYTAEQVAQVIVEITAPAVTAVGAQPLIVGQGAAIQRSHNW